jgi:hypothetical protein
MACLEEKRQRYERDKRREERVKNDNMKESISTESQQAFIIASA